MLHREELDDASNVFVGSALSNGLAMAFCDDAVKMIDFAIDPETHRAMGNRQDAKPVESPSR
jgi:hypothetical protein